MSRVEDDGSIMHCWPRSTQYGRGGVSRIGLRVRIEPISRPSHRGNDLPRQPMQSEANEP